MNAKRTGLVLVGLAGTALLAGIWQAAEAPADTATLVQPARTAGFTTTPHDTATAVAAKPAPVQLPPAVIQPARASVPVPAVIDQSAPAEVSMAKAREQGDDRAPPINRVPETDQPPTAAEQADPLLYAKYEKRQSSRAYASYVQAADAAIPEQQQELEQAKAQGITPEQLATGEEKIRLMQQMRDRLLNEHPEIAQ